MQKAIEPSKLFHFSRQPKPDCKHVPGMLIPLLVMVFCMMFSAASGQNIETTYISLNLKNTPLKAALGEIQKQSGIRFMYNDDIREYEAVHITQSARRISVKSAVEIALRNTGLQYKVKEGFIIITKKTPAPVAPPQVKDPGRVTGRIIDEESGQPVADVSIRIGNRGAISMLNGEFQLLLPEGKYEAEISAVGYGKKQVTDIEVKSRQTVELNLTLKREKGQLSTVVVKSSVKKETIASLYARQRNNVAISDGISQEQIKATPDNNAAQVLKRVSGLTVQDEKFVTVRGLSDRYNTILLNGASLPSTEPNRRNFSFDIIPSGIIDNIVVNKTATPELSAEFAGGVVQVNTRDMPAENYLSLTAGTGINTNSTGKPVYSSPRGDRDFVGFDDGKRQWWKKGWDRHAYTKFHFDADQQSMGAMNQKIPNRWGLYKYDYRPVQNYQLALGRKITTARAGDFGITAAGLFRHEENTENEERRTYTGEEYNYSGHTYNYRSSLAGMLNLAWRYKGSKIILRNLYNRAFSNETNVYYGSIQGFGSGDARTYTNITLINEIRQHRLEGEQAFGKKGFKADWYGDWVTSTRDQPDTRNVLGFYNPNHPQGFYTYNFNDGTGFLGRGASLFNAELKEDKYNWGLNLHLPFTLLGREQKIKSGYAGIYREADFTAIGLMARHMGTNADYDKETMFLPEYEILDPKFFKPGYLYYSPTGPNAAGDGSGEDYHGIQRLHAAYLMADMQLLKKLRLTGGVRMEDNEMQISTVIQQSGKNVDTSLVFKKRNWLPSANLVYTLAPKMNLRLAYSQTLSRPDFRERSGFIYYEFKQRAQYIGRHGLRDTRIENYDLRYEFYPSAGEVLSASLFYKKFHSPVELLVIGSSAGNESYYYFNLVSSVSTGVELDFRKSLGFIHPSSTWLKQVYVSGNAAWLRSNVKYDAQQLLAEAEGNGYTEVPGSKRERPLQGLSPYVYNAGIGYSGKPVGINISYNRYGPRIVAGGLYPKMDQYENARDVIDLQISARFLKDKLELRCNLSDLLQQDHVIYENGPLSPGTEDNANHDPKKTRYNPELDYARFKSFKGRNISLNITYQF